MGKGLFLDLDGTLADNLGVMYAVYERFLKIHGHAAKQEEFNSLNGPPLPEVVRRLKEAHGLSGSVEELLNSYYSVLDRLYMDAPVSLFAADALKDAKSRKWIVAIVTSNSQQRASAWLTHHKISPWVDFVISGDMCPRGKPAPDPYIMALELAKCSAKIAFAVEDSLQGVQSAMSAGLNTFGYMNDKRNGVKFPEGAMRLKRFDELIGMIEKHG